MASAAAELQKAIHAALTGNEDVTRLTGGPRVYDFAPERARFPYITIGRTSVYDWSTGDDSGSEHLVTLHVWSRARGKAEAHAIIEAAEQALRDFSPDLEGHRLVGLFREFAEVYFDVEMELQHGLLRYRALVEERAGAA
ncbi:MAG: DUF3168 domain-containing protein [Zhengella sp.]|uniref:DUF3168 domain-containing protein n=1 Tax=Zhengella sp. TaxID=2282762 RepID=UPI001D7AD077|nr:DUF3168 domain-containing protein [Notoacmeibacter sp.]MCC0026356.1 DUF3168 domain-containing protein [Brucellaceae bacterium]